MAEQTTQRARLPLPSPPEAPDVPLSSASATDLDNSRGPVPDFHTRDGATNPRSLPMDPTARAALQAAAAADHRADQIDGLRELAAFLDTHPEVPVPETLVIVAQDPAAIVGFLDGLDDIELAGAGAPAANWSNLVRWFGPLKLQAMVPSRELGITAPEPVEQPPVVVPTIDEARSRLCSALAAEAATELADGEAVPA